MSRCARVVSCAAASAGGRRARSSATGRRARRRSERPRRPLSSRTSTSRCGSITAKRSGDAWPRGLRTQAKCLSHTHLRHISDNISDNISDIISDNISNNIFPKSSLKPLSCRNPITDMFFYLLDVAQPEDDGVASLLTTHGFRSGKKSLTLPVVTHRHVFIFSHPFPHPSAPVHPPFPSLFLPAYDEGATGRDAYGERRAPPLTHWSGTTIDFAYVHTAPASGWQVLRTHVHYTDLSDHLPVVVEFGPSGSE